MYEAKIYIFICINLYSLESKWWSSVSFSPFALTHIRSHIAYIFLLFGCCCKHTILLSHFPLIVTHLGWRAFAWVVKRVSFNGCLGTNTAIHELLWNLRLIALDMEWSNLLGWASWKIVLVKGLSRWILVGLLLLLIQSIYWSLSTLKRLRVVDEAVGVVVMKGLHLMHHIIRPSAHVTTRSSNNLLYWIIGNHLLFIMNTWLSLSRSFLLLLSGWSINMFLMNNYVRVYVSAWEDRSREGLDILVCINSPVYSMGSHHIIARISKLLHRIVVHITWVMWMSIINGVLRKYLLWLILLLPSTILLVLHYYLLIHNYKRVNVY